MADMVYCRGCGKEIHKTAPACPACGARQVASRKNQKSKVVAGVLALLLGAFGVHRFYLGKWWGIFYLLFFWTWIPGLIAFIEGIVFLCTNDERWDEVHNEGVPSSTGGGAVAVAIVVGAIGFIAIIGILAAIAIPAYQDYTVRAKTADAVRSATAAANAVGAYVERNRSVPESVQEAGFTDPLSRYVKGIAVNKRTGVLTITMTGSPVDGKSFLFVPAPGADKGITWRCAPADLPAKWLPQACRQPLSTD